MRRTNTRKRNKINLKNLNKKTLRIIYFLSILLIIFIFIYLYFIRNIFIKGNFEKEYTKISSLNDETVFSLNKIVFFSSATVDAKELNNAVWNLNISQYTDIAIYLNNSPNSNSNKNTVKEFYINNISITPTEYGTPCLYKKSKTDFGRSSYSDENKINDNFYFNIESDIANINNSNNSIDKNLSSPLILGFYNKDVKTNFLYSEQQIEHNGKILKRASIPMRSIKANVSFDINIINDANEHYICNVGFEIPFENDNSSIYEDGYITKEINNLDNYKFLRIK